MDLKFENISSFVLDTFLVIYLSQVSYKFSMFCPPSSQPCKASKVPPNVWTLVCGLLIFELYSIRLKENNLLSSIFIAPCIFYFYL